MLATAQYDFHNHTYHSVNTRKGQIVWLSIVLASLSVALLFLTTAALDFSNRAVVTTIETTTAPLQVDHSFYPKKLI